MTADEYSAVAQALDEVVLAGMNVEQILAEIGLGVEDAVKSAYDIARGVYTDTTPQSAREWATGAALFGMAIGIRGERVRQRRHGDHPSEAVPA